MDNECVGLVRKILFLEHLCGGWGHGEGVNEFRMSFMKLL